MNTLPIILPKETCQVSMEYNQERKSFETNNLIMISL